MTSYQPIDWHNTDDGDPVPVHSRDTTHPHQPAHVMSFADLPQHPDTAHVVIGQSANSLKLAAAMGIGAVLALGLLFFNGLSNLRGDLTPALRILVTEAGQFEPASIEVWPGRVIEIENTYKDPVVIKSEPELFQPAVAFSNEAIVSLTVPADVQPGEYIVTSQTLPEDRKLIIRVLAAAPVETASSSTSSVAALTGIPIPDDIEQLTPPQQETVVPVQQTQVAQSQNTGNEALIEISTQGSSSVAQAMSTSSTAIVSNPYTVDKPRRQALMLPVEGKKTTTAGTMKNTDTVSKLPVAENLHGGAPQQQTYKQPRTIVATGIGTWMAGGAVMIAMGGVALIARRKVR